MCVVDQERGDSHIACGEDTCRGTRCPNYASPPPLEGDRLHALLAEFKINMPIVLVSRSFNLGFLSGHLDRRREMKCAIVRMCIAPRAIKSRWV